MALAQVDLEEGLAGGGVGVRTGKRQYQAMVIGFFGIGLAIIVVAGSEPIT